MGQPLISVLLPAYNAATYLRPAVASVLNQTLGDFELICVDDGSTDATPGILRDFASRDARVKVISRPNTGIVGALNDAIAASSGQYLARMDGDDICHRERFARQVEHLDTAPDTVLLGTNVVVMDEDGDLVAPMRDLAFEHEAIEKMLLESRWPLVHPSVMIRRDAMDRIGGYREGTFPHEDHDIFLRLGEVGRLAALPDCLLHYRRHSRSVSYNSRSWRHLDAMVRDARVRRGLAEYWDEPPGRKEFSDREQRRLHCRLLRAMAWQALGAGNLGTARKYTLRTLRAGLIEPETLKLVACVVRGR